MTSSSTASKRNVARECDTTVQYLWQLAYQHRRPSVELATKIEHATRGAVTVDDLRPELVRTTRRQNEASFQKMVIQYAELSGWRVYHVTNVSGRLRATTSPGFPDLVLVRGERMVFAELKTDRGKTTKAQDEWLSALRQTPAEVFLWRPRDWDEIERTLAR